MGRKASFNKILAIEMFKAGMNYEEIAKQLNSTREAIRKVIKRNASELNKNPLNKDEVIKLYKRKMSYSAIAQKLNSTEAAIKMFIKRNSPELMRERKASMNNSGLFEPTPEEFNLVNLGLLSIEDRKQLMEARTYGIDNNESMSVYSFLKWNRHSYIANKQNGKLTFDVTRGAITKDVPKSFTPTDLPKLTPVEFVFNINAKFIRDLNEINTDLIPEKLIFYLEKNYRNKDVYKERDIKTESKLQFLLNQSNILFKIALKEYKTIKYIESFKHLLVILQLQNKLQNNSFTWLFFNSIGIDLKKFPSTLQ